MIDDELLQFDGEEICFSPEEFCSFARISFDTLQRYRRKGTGPREVRIGSVVRVLKSDGVEWLRSKRMPARDSGIRVESAA